MSQWYLSYDGRQTGPMDQSRAANQARANPKETAGPPIALPVLHQLPRPIDGPAILGYNCPS